MNYLELINNYPEKEAFIQIFVKTVFKYIICHKMKLSLTLPHCDNRREFNLH